MSEQEIQNIVQMNTALRNENAVLKEQLALLQEQYDWLKKQVFGRKSEQISVIMDYTPARFHIRRHIAKNTNV